MIFPAMKFSLPDYNLAPKLLIFCDCRLWISDIQTNINIISSSSQYSLILLNELHCKGKQDFECLLYNSELCTHVRHPTFIWIISLIFWTSVQVSSATATFAMTFSSSMSVVEYYLLKRFPVPYGLALSLSRYWLELIISFLSRNSLQNFITYCH